MSKKESKRLAIEMRTVGKSMREIARDVGVSISSVCRWTKDVVLSEVQLINLQQKRRSYGYRNGQLSHIRAVNRHKTWRSNGYNRAKVDSYFLVICAIYWGEGTKASKSFQLSNSDWTMLKVVVDWLKSEGLLNRVKIKAYYYLENCISSKEIKEWWLNKLNLTESNWTKPVICIINRASQRKRIGKLPYGTVSINLSKGMELFFNILGGIDYLVDSSTV
jgi:hypothetical protein